MKKTFFFILGAAAMLLASCAKELNAPVESPKSLVTFVANAGSKTIIADNPDKDGNYAVTWKEGDKITIIDADGYSASYTVKPEENNTNEIVFGVEVGSAPYTAIAGPVEEVVKDGEAYKVKMKDPDGSFGGADLLATRSSSNMLTFHHALSFVEFRIENKAAGIDKVSFSTPENFFSKNINLSWDGEDITASVIKETKDGADWTTPCTLEMDLLEDTNDAIVYVPIIKGEYTGFDIRYTDVNGMTYQGLKMDKSFSASEGGVTFGVEDTDVIEGEKSLVENFNNTKVTNVKVGAGDNFTTQGNTAGFNFEWSSKGSVYVFHNGIRLGSGSATGSVTNSTILSKVLDGPFTVKVYAAVWNTDGGKISVTYNGEGLTVSPKNNSISDPTNTAYSAADFATATEFVFNKVQDINEFTVGTTEKRIIIDKIEIVEGGVLPEPFSVSPNALTPKWDDEEASFSITAGDNVNWTIGAVDGLTFSQTTGKGESEITVYFDKNEEKQQIQKTITVSTDYESVKGEKEYTISFTQAGKPDQPLDGDGSKEKPYSISDALYLINNLSDGEVSGAAYYIAGNICEITSYYSSGKSINYHIGTEEQNVYVYGGKDLGNGGFTSKEDLSVGDELIVYGNFQKYVNKDSEVTPEIVNSYIYSYNGKTSILTGITLGEKKTAYEIEDTFEAPKVTANYRGKASKEVTAEFSGYDLSKAGEYTVKASYTEGDITKTAEYGITVSDGTAYDITINVNDGSMGSASATVGGSSATTAKAGEEVTVTITPNTGHILSAITLNYEDKTAQVENNKFIFNMPEGGVTIYVTFAEKPKIIADGNYAIIAKDNNAYFAVSSDANGNSKRRDRVSVSYNGGNSFETSNEKLIWTLKSSGDTYSIANGSNFIGAGKNILPLENTGTAVTIAKNTDGTYTLTADCGTDGTRYMALNGTYGFGWYAGVSALHLVPATYAEPTYHSITVSPSDNGTVTIEGNKTQAIAGESITLNVTPDSGYKLASLTYNSNDITSAKSFIMPAENVTIEATFEENGGQGGDNYVLCTSTSDLVAGAHYIIASGMSGDVYCISNVNNSNNRKTVKATVSDSKIAVSSSSEIMTFTLGESSKNWTLQTDNYAGNNGYLASAASGKNNYCRVISDETTCTIEFSNKAAEIKLQPHSERNLLRFNPNNGSPIFACYSSGQNAIYLYKKSN